MTEQSETPFRIYQRDTRSENVIKCKVSTDDLSLGEALLDFHKRGVPVIGIQYRPIDGRPGVWLVNPWTKTP